MSRTPLSREKDNDPGESSGRLGKEVTMIRPHGCSRLRGGILPLGLLVPLAFLTPPPASAQTQQQFPPTQGTTENHAAGHRMLSAVPDADNIAVRPDSAQLSPKQKMMIMHANFEKSKSDAAELAALAKGLREALDKPDVNVLSLEVMNRIDKIEKLAKRIRVETKGF